MQRQLTSSLVGDSDGTHFRSPPSTRDDELRSRIGRIRTRTFENNEIIHMNECSPITVHLYGPCKQSLDTPRASRRLSTLRSNVHSTHHFLPNVTKTIGLLSNTLILQYDASDDSDTLYNATFNVLYRRFAVIDADDYKTKLESVSLKPLL